MLFYLDLSGKKFGQKILRSKNFKQNLFDQVVEAEAIQKIAASTSPIALYYCFVVRVAHYTLFFVVQIVLKQVSIIREVALFIEYRLVEAEQDCLNRLLIFSHLFSAKQAGQILVLRLQLPCMYEIQLHLVCQLFYLAIFIPLNKENEKLSFSCQCIFIFKLILQTTVAKAAEGDDRS